MFENIKKHLYHIYGNNISVHLSGSTIEKIQTNIGLKCKTVDLVVIIHKFFNIAIVWNIKARREQGCNAFSLTYSKSWKNLMCDNHEILTIYKTFKAKECECYEKVIVLDLDTLIELSSCLPELLEFDSEDVGFPTVCKNSLSKETKIRTRNTTSRWNRDRKFSKGVLDAYHYQCAICRCDIPQLLEAAHEREYEVCNTVADMVEHGICLCSNHHAMYDRKDANGIHLIDIDMNNGTIKINDERIKKMPWYQKFCNEYDAKLLKPAK